MFELPQQHFPEMLCVCLSPLSSKGNDGQHHSLSALCLVSCAWSSQQGMGSTSCFAFSCILMPLSLLDTVGALSGKKQHDWDFPPGKSHILWTERANRRYCFCKPAFGWVLVKERLSPKGLSSLLAMQWLGFVSTSPWSSEGHRDGAKWDETCKFEVYSYGEWLRCLHVRERLQLHLLLCRVAHRSFHPKLLPAAQTVWLLCF